VRHIDRNTLKDGLRHPWTPADCFLPLRPHFGGTPPPAAPGHPWPAQPPSLRTRRRAEWNVCLFCGRQPTSLRFMAARPACCALPAVVMPPPRSCATHSRKAMRTSSVRSLCGQLGHNISRAWYDGSIINITPPAIECAEGQTSRQGNRGSTSLPFHIKDVWPFDAFRFVIGLF